MATVAMLLGALLAGINIGLALRTVWKEWRSWRQPASDRQADALDAINHAIERIAVALEQQSQANRIVELEAEVERLRDRLQIIPGGGDRIEELEAEVAQLRAKARSV